MLAAGAAAAAELRDVRVWDGPENTRVVFDLSAGSAHRVFSLQNPHRVVVDLDGAKPASAFDPAKVAERGILRGVRSAVQPDGRLRVVLDLGDDAAVRSFALTPQGDYGHRVVVDLSRSAGGGSPSSTTASAPAQSESSVVAPVSRLETKEIIVAIDAGHGGEDPGARGPSGLLEKNVVLDISRKLAERIDREPGYRAVMIRTGDYYVGLRERVNRARQAQADLFVSVHANAFSDARVRGSAVYTLSMRGATSEQARWMAQRENAADLIGGVDISDKEDTLAHVLLDISQSAAIEASIDAGKRVLDSLGRFNTLQRTEVQRANFAVLRAPDIPSMLVETAFITNPGEERKLGSADYQRRIAEAVFEGIESYFEYYRPLRYVDGRPADRRPGADSQQYTVRRGDTLSEIAQRYRVDQRRLRQVNNLNSDVLRVGQVLQIP